MTQEFVPYEHALALKELGFDEPCFGGYDMETLKLWIGYLNDGEQFNREYYYPAPTYSQAFRWIREKFKLHYPIAVRNNRIWIYDKWSLSGYKTNEESELACLRKLI